MLVADILSIFLNLPTPLMPTSVILDADTESLYHQATIRGRQNPGHDGRAQ
jgi:hypothetical protein